jgi:hypothetical protein
MIETEYVVEPSQVKAMITLPSNLSGELQWKGRILKLHEGKQELQLSPE